MIVNIVKPRERIRAAAGERIRAAAGVTNGQATQIRAIDDEQVQKAVNTIVDDIQKNDKMKEGKQLNLSGYSYGAVLQSYVAIALAERGYKVDNLILYGSPTSENSELMAKLCELKEQGKIGNIKLEKLKGDKLSNPETEADYYEGIKQSAPEIVGGQGDRAPHFDLARPGNETNIRIAEEAVKQKKEGVQ